LAGTIRFGILTMAKLLLLVFCCIIFFGSPSRVQADEKVFAGWILHMFLSGQLKEYTPRGGMTECLSVKRKIMRSQGHLHQGARWECKTGKLVLRKYNAGQDGNKWLPVEHLGND